MDDLLTIDDLPKVDVPVGVDAFGKGVFDSDERRRSDRRKTNWPFEASTEDGVAFKGRLLDIGPKGARIVSSLFLDGHKEISIKIHTFAFGKRKDTQFKCKVVYACIGQDRFKAGLYFIDHHSEHGDYIKNFVAI